MGKSENIKEVLLRRLKHYGIDKAALASRVCAEAQIVARGDFEVVSYKNGSLKLRVGSPAKAHLIRLRQKSFILETNRRLGQELVKRVRFEIEG